MDQVSPVEIQEQVNALARAFAEAKEQFVDRAFRHFFSVEVADAICEAARDPLGNKLVSDLYEELGFRMAEEPLEGALGFVVSLHAFIPDGQKSSCFQLAECTIKYENNQITCRSAYAAPAEGHTVFPESYAPLRRFVVSWARIGLRAARADN